MIVVMTVMVMSDFRESRGAQLGRLVACARRQHTRRSR